MMSPWNTPCGVAVHAELVGREWIRMGHDLTVFAPDESVWGKPKTHEDEPFVKRCYILNRNFIGIPEEIYFDPKPLLEFEGDAFVVQNLELMPIFGLRRIWDSIKCDRKILVIHEGSPPMFYEFYSFEFDKIVCFDRRYFDVFSKYFPSNKIEIIPYPCHKLQLGDKEEARKKLGLPLDKKIVFTFGMDVSRAMAILPVLEKINKDYPLIFLAISTEKPIDLLSKRLQKYPFLVLRKEVLTLEKLYEYLHASDLLILHKGKTGNIVVSSTVYLCLGSGCPIVIRRSRFTEPFGSEVFKYDDPWELERIIRGIFKGTLTPNARAIKRILRRHDPERVAKKFIKIMK